MNAKFATVVLVVILATLALPNVQASSITRSFSNSLLKPSESVTVSLNVSITGGESFYLIDEIVPEGWTIISSSGNGSTIDPGHVKWAEIQNVASVIYTYVTKAPSDVGMYSFTGKYMFEGMKSEGSIDGQKSLTVSASSGQTGNNLGLYGLLPQLNVTTGVVLVIIILVVVAGAYYALRKRSSKPAVAAAT